MLADECNSGDQIAHVRTPECAKRQRGVRDLMFRLQDRMRVLCCQQRQHNTCSSRVSTSSTNIKDRSIKAKSCDQNDVPSIQSMCQCKYFWGLIARQCMVHHRYGHTACQQRRNQQHLTALLEIWHTIWKKMAGGLWNSKSARV